MDEVAAGIQNLDIFGHFKTIDALANGDILKYDEILKQPYSTVVLKLQYSAKVAKYQEKLAEIKRRKAKNNARGKR